MQINIPDTDWSASSGTADSSKIGQDLYKKILGHLTIAPDQKALANTANAYGSTQSDMILLLNNNFSPILQKSPYLTQAQAIQKMTEIQRKYQDEKDIYAIQTDINATVTPNEIFENGDTSDSPFDLITDLNNIQNILFKKVDPIDIGGNFNLSSSGGVGAGSGSGTQGAVTGPTSAQKGPSTGGNTGSASSASTQAGGASGNTGNNNNGSDTSGLGSKPDASTNPNICFGSNSLDKALSDFDKKKATDANYKETPTQPSSSNQTNNSGSATSDQNNSSGHGGGSLQPQPFTYNPPETQSTVAAPASNWLTTPPCTDIFCIQVNFVKKPVSSYVDADNCIACHVEKIDEKLKETIGHSLIPGKATGNLIEPGICKQATADLMRSVNMRFYAVAKPIKTPTNDDLVYGTSASDEFTKFLNTYKPFPFYEQKVPDPKDPTQDTSVPSVVDSATKAALQYATADTTFSALSNQIQQQVQGTQNAIAQQAAVYDASVKTDTDSSFYQSIRNELDQMNFYFDNFQTILNTINNNVPNSGITPACQTLANLSECT